MKQVLQDAILHGLYDLDYPGHEFLSPKLLTNNKDEKIWSTLRQELRSCEHFTWAVAFITQDMLVPFKLVMEDLARKNIRGTIITGSYLNFNHPKVFAELAKIPNLDLKICDKNFHVKGYLFDHGDYQTLIIGSANFTRSALLSNCEWSLKLSSKNNAALTQQISQDLLELEANSQTFSYDWLKEYAQNWQPVKQSHSVNQKSRQILPNQMQKAALENLRQLVQAGSRRALVVSATGTGKTYLGAFAVKDFQPKRFLFLVHRQQIAKKAMKSFQKVIGGPSSQYGLYSGSHHDLTAKYLFSTIQTMAQAENLAQFASDEFDYILIDEAHRSAAKSYQKIFDHFQPKFYLGMTATPERMDQQNIYQLFDYNLAYEIRLRDALEEKMLSPFHYVGVTDYVLDGEEIDETTDLRYLTTDKRVDYLLKEIDYYGYCGESLRGLIFASRQQEARELAEIFSQRGHASVALTNQDSETRRQEVVDQLEKGQIEYIITVDLFNEGIDIPSVNQLIFLRNTQSQIVFTQQLGRGLRKYPGKDYVTVIDFIGNYKNNYLIPLALHADTSRDKDLARREIKLASYLDVSTINFSQIASEKILASLEKVKLDSIQQLRQSYQELKEKLGRMPLLYDFYQYGSSSPLVFSKNAGFKNYGQFLLKMGEKIDLSDYGEKVLDFVTQELLNGKRPHELLLLEKLLVQKEIAADDFVKLLEGQGVYVNEAVLTSIDQILSLDFFEVKAGKTTRKMQYGNLPLIEHDLLTYRFSKQLAKELHQPDFKLLLADLIKTGLALNHSYDNLKQFTLYKQYDREDVCRLLNWPLDVSAPMYGYRVGENEMPIFITYKKESEEKRNAIYDNQLINGQSLRWYTRSPRHLYSNEVKKLLDPGMKIHLFVKQSDQIGKEFFYLGQAEIVLSSVKEEQIGPKHKNVVGMDLRLKQPLSGAVHDLIFE